MSRGVSVVNKALDICHYLRRRCPNGAGQSTVRLQFAIFLVDWWSIKQTGQQISDATWQSQVTGIRAYGSFESPPLRRWWPWRPSGLTKIERALIDDAISAYDLYDAGILKLQKLHSQVQLYEWKQQPLTESVLELRKLVRTC